MEKPKKEILYHILFWLIVVAMLTIIFGGSWGSRINAFYFVIMLLPAVMLTSYFFNYYLVPKFLLKERYFLFILYLLYTFIVSLWLEVIVLMLAFIYLANFNLGEMGPNSHNTLVLGMVMYMIVFIASFLLLIRQYSLNQKEIKKLEHEKDKLRMGFLEITSRRIKTRIPYKEIIYIESLGDYLRIHHKDQEETDSKEKISSLEKRLPETFIRIHRSFIVNRDKVSAVSYEEVTLGNIKLNIGRSYKKKVIPLLKTN